MDHLAKKNHAEEMASRRIQTQIELQARRNKGEAENHARWRAEKAEAERQKQEELKQRRRLKEEKLMAERNELERRQTERTRLEALREVNIKNRELNRQKAQPPKQAAA